MSFMNKLWLIVSVILLALSCRKNDFITSRDAIVLFSADTLSFDTIFVTTGSVTQSVYGTPQRTVSGFDARRLQLLLAVLEKRGGFHFGVKDVFLNIAGGLKVEDPSIDLAVLCALLSSYEDIPLASQTCFAGEVGLSGEIRAVNRIEQRIAEAEKLGFEKIFVSKYNQKGLTVTTSGIEVIPVGRVEEVYRYLF